MPFKGSRSLTLVIGLLIVGCADLPKDTQRIPSTAVPNYLDTSVGQLFEEAASQHPGESGFAIIRWGREAFTDRIALTELAEKSLDLQYYIWEPDATGHILAQRLIRAADRGVRVRILVDDINLAGRDPFVAAMDAHPGIEIRIFNPFANRSVRFFDVALDLDRVNHRMHNKTMNADNAVAIVGGRNVGDIYFQVATETNYRDLDVAAAGPIVREISNVFDYFWNGEWAVPITALVDRPYGNKDLEAFRAYLHDRIAGYDYPYALDEDVEALRERLTSERDQFVWARGQIVWDDPAAIEGHSEQGRIMKGLAEKVDSLREELLIESAYFVIKQPYVDKVRELTDRGVRVRVLTNSLASNDVIAAHAGHAKHREDLLANGMELYEWRADAGAIRKRLRSTAKSRAALHAKALVFDRESVFIGSFNLDPRSASINTEAGLYVESPELAQQVIAYMDQAVRPENSYKVELDEDGDLVWLTEVDGQQVQLHEEPGSSFTNDFLTGLIMILPVEDQL
ncbi:MAG: phospholipase D family protein [Pseudomonadota bacterium]